MDVSLNRSFVLILLIYHIADYRISKVKNIRSSIIIILTVLPVTHYYAALKLEIALTKR